MLLIIVGKNKTNDIKIKKFDFDDGKMSSHFFQLILTLHQKGFSHSFDL